MGWIIGLLVAIVLLIGAQEFRDAHTQKLLAAILEELRKTNQR